MKKLLALLLALVMALGCFGAFAEDAQSNELTIDIPAFTLALDSNVNVDALLAVLPLFGIDEATLSQFQTILPLLANVNGQLVFADNGIQFDLGLKGQTVLTVAGEQTEGGFALASDILPSYVLTLSNETIEALMSQFSAQAEDAFANVNMEAIMESLTGYATQFVGACTQAVTMGDAELGEFAFEDLEKTFNCRVPIIVDTDAIKGALETLIAQIKADENFGSLVSALGSMNLPVDMSEETAVIMPDEVTAYAYANVDEEGNAVDDTQLITVETVTTAEGQTVAVNVTVLVEGQAVAVIVDIPDQDISVAVNAQATEEGAFAVSLCFEGQGITAAEVISFAMGDEGLVMYCESYLMDMENPICTETITFVLGGERTFPVLDENKAVLTVEQLMADTTGEAIGLLQADLMGNGLGNLIAKISQIMPDEVASLMSLFYGTAAVEGAAE